MLMLIETSLPESTAVQLVARAASAQKLVDGQPRLFVPLATRCRCTNVVRPGASIGRSRCGLHLASLASSAGVALSTMETERPTLIGNLRRDA